ncbi:glycerophosphodiester phosphodiesterase family protein [Microbacterium azadirachtae]|uniref:glycerophosphodiester phosphodiesterase family protein n=1 Tax=Microbacterium azadirachtae TaxID=582680 RepID=UPI00087E4C39|nr:glycerophosphodiester phosphodiesterase family protein [Microbacterium azadirachtae]SDM08928.1 glycerophosphoryl diester phosphodiesterase [Microbacterium azadirachtae]SEG34034.1 glycerophosphoryl diester phosphodiesterase [Microbacterium azadirachtae]SEG36832.1 glycerophosphoryl diester phosphodiesterase [Microbacterium azadirachtae]
MTRRIPPDVSPTDPSVRPLLIGHRGAPGYRPEHTTSSYRLAFAMGADAVEPDVVVTADGVLVIRHENEISGTTDVADHPEFADRRTTKRVDGERLTGWFTEDFTWAELATLRCRERIPALRPGSAEHDDTEPILRLTDLLELVGEASAEQGRAIGVVLEVKHATYFAGIGRDPAPLVERDLREAGWASGEHPLWIESFEQTVLAELRGRGVRAVFVYLLEAAGSPADLVARDGRLAQTYADALTPAGLDVLARDVDGISVDKQLLLQDAGPHLVDEAHRRGLRVFTWTCRPENAFLDRRFRRSGGAAAFGDYRAEWARIAETGLDGVFVDHPDLGTEAFRS